MKGSRIEKNKRERIRENVREIKMQLRTDYKKKRAAISPDEKSAMDAEIVRRIIGLRSYSYADNLLLYYPLPEEIDVLPLAAQAIADGKAVYFPISWEKGIMEFRRVVDLNSEFTLGKFGIKEPSNKCPLLDKSEVKGASLVIMPALSFDRDGYRLGYGKGYYDRYLIDLSASVIGVVYDSMLADRLPRGKFDRHADLVLTEKQLIIV